MWLQAGDESKTCLKRTKNIWDCMKEKIYGSQVLITDASFCAYLIRCHQLIIDKETLWSLITDAIRRKHAAMAFKGFIEVVRHCEIKFYVQE